MTITAKEISRYVPKHGGTDVTVSLTDSETGMSKVKTFHVKGKLREIAVEKKIESMKSRFGFDINPLNGFRFEGVEDSKEFIKGAVDYIRKNPKCAFNDFVTSMNTSFSDDVDWKMESLCLKLQTDLGLAIKEKTMSFEQFKEYVIKNKMNGLD